MINVIDFYNDVVLGDLSKDLNGSVDTDLFNRSLWRAQLRTLGWLTGNLDDANPPQSTSTEKARSWVSPFIKKKSIQVYDGQFERPADYYLFNNLYRLQGNPVFIAGEEQDELEVVQHPIEILSDSKFTTRCSTHIKRLKPELKPIAKEIGGVFETAPKDIGSVLLEYYRYPVKAMVVMKIDEERNDEIPDTVNSVDLEWNEGVRQTLIYFMNEQISLHIREMGFQQQNTAGKQ